MLCERSQKQRRLCNFDAFLKEILKHIVPLCDRDGQLPWTANIHEEKFGVMKVLIVIGILVTEMFARVKLKL